MIAYQKVRLSKIQLLLELYYIKLIIEKDINVKGM